MGTLVVYNNYNVMYTHITNSFVIIIIVILYYYCKPSYINNFDVVIYTTFIIIIT